MSDTVQSEFAGTAALAVAAIAALLLTLFRAPAAIPSADRYRTTALFLAGVTFQALHFGEEYATHFYDRFPRLLGLSAWSPRFFLVFNCCWLLVWLAAAFGFRAGNRAAFFPVWFFAIAAVMNGVAHPLLALVTHGYFPGLATSPFLGIIGIWLWLRLWSITASHSREAHASSTRL